MMSPTGPHDDQVDSLTQALEYLNKRTGPIRISKEVKDLFSRGPSRWTSTGPLGPFARIR